MRLTPLLVFRLTVVAALSGALLAPVADARPVKATATAPKGKPAAKKGKRKVVAKASAEPSAAPLPGPEQLLEHQVILPADGPYSLDVSNLRGRILARGWNKNVVYIHATKHMTNPLDGREAELYGYAKAGFLETTPGHVKVETQIAGAGDLPEVAAERVPHVQVDYELYVPPDCALTIHQEDGPLVILDVSGKVEAFTRDGDVSLTNITGWAEGSNERGNLHFTKIHGDAIGKSIRGSLRFKQISGDVKAATGTGNVRVDVPGTWVGQVAYHTVSGKFRSDLATFHTDMQPGDTGYQGVLRGPLAGHEMPTLRFTFDTESGDAIVATDRQASY